MEYTVTIGEKSVIPQRDESNGFYYVDVEDISATDYGVQYVVTIGDNTVQYSVLNYLVNSVKKEGEEGKEALVNLVKAMYDYYEAAKAYESAN